jgi:hypothetical protein
MRTDVKGLELLGGSCRVRGQTQVTMRASILSILTLVSGIALAAPAPSPNCHRWRLAGIVLGESKEQAEFSLQTKLKLTASSAEENGCKFAMALLPRMP